MNNIKKSLLSPEPLMYARRSSLPVSLDNGIENSPLTELVKKFNFSQRNLEVIENEGDCSVPQIVLPSPTEANLSPCNSEVSSPCLNDGNESDKIKDGTIRRYMARRASCEANFFPASPEADGAKTSPWSKRTLAYCKSISPVQRNAEELSKRKSEISSGRIQQYMHFPSLSPCFEGKPKQNCFPFYVEKDRNCEEIISGEIIEGCKVGGFHGSRRRETIHDYHSPTLRVYENILTPKTKQRRNSFGTTSVNLSPNQNKSSALDLQRGNPNLNTRRKCDSTILGKGGFGVVKSGFWHGEKVAVKILKGKKAIKSLENELSSLAFGFHMNLVKTKAIVLSKDSINAEIKYSYLPKDNEIEDNNEIRSYFVPIENVPVVVGMRDEISPKGLSFNWSLVISELCTSDNLLSIINRNSPLADKDLLRFLYQIASALKYMHEVGYAHLDVKPSNCFLTSSGVIKLGDFGCICKLNNIPSQSLGTIAYQAPEVLRGKPVTDICDIYSLGITAWQMLTREVPYDGEHPHVVIYKVTRMNQRPASNKQIRPSFIEEALFYIAERCWSVIPSERPSVDTLISIVTSLYFACSVSPLPKNIVE